jgi:hypothetical protein
VPEELREQIETAMDDACEDGSLRWKRIINRIEIEPNPNYKPRQAVKRKSNMTDQEGYEAAIHRGDALDPNRFQGDDHGN